VSKPDIFKLLDRATVSCLGKSPDTILPLPVSGSTRQYYRIKIGDKSIVGVWSDNAAENEAFVHFTKHFRGLDLNVPELFYTDLKKNIYLVEDLGDETLYSYMTKKASVSKKSDITKKSDVRKTANLIQKSTGSKTKYTSVQSESNYIQDNACYFYQSALRHLIRFQLEGPKGLDFSYCIPRPVFDEQSILWDLQYFKYYVLKLFNIPFDEQKLEEDLIRASRLLASVDNKYFMYRDFQSRNIMIHNNDLYFVDYQGGRKGPLHYDLASLLFEARINLMPDLREELTDYYISELSGRIQINRQEFLLSFYQFVFLRILQVLAAYGLRGYVQNKSIFLKSYPFAVNNLEWLLNKSLIKLNAPELLKAAEGVLKISEIRESYFEPEAESGFESKSKSESESKSESKSKSKSESAIESLNIHIHSFSYKYGIPKDFSGNGGGFVFDCRILPNPGRYPEFKEMTGTDKPVISYLEKHAEVRDFLDNVRNIIDIAIKDYLDRGMNRLMVSFGCTGGQHRSVYCAGKIAEYISEKYNVRTTVVHGYYKNIGK
jgi:aminoglycoside/choline kinase family phosphotransferase